ncbi:undecaprenyldiphospho-muramoylpentapeptide beta-N-acetylglucosaminyltransferase [bacterium]|nr:undecaprenyldiphospho-muramoylpentapeptide beta-N-acetylglucosaminyltransferase [bacterium]MBU1918475.1 undecaprenyldiphospho-muramoylpentapeptide beta-N-acetylglucosaminyltransferase [bacterium]
MDDKRIINKKLLITGGGTGGHVSPGIAVAQEWVKQGGKVVFVGTKQGQESSMVPHAGFDLRCLRISQFKSGGLVKKIMTLIQLPFAVFSACRIIIKEKPALILGTGGYVSGPTCLAGFLMKKPIAIQDQNARPGITNRFLGRLAQKVFTTFSQSHAFFNKNKICHTGNPIRAQLKQIPYTTHQEILNIFITGGSQGAVGMNKLIMEAIDHIKDLWPRLNITHQTAKTDINEVTDFYKNRSIQADVKSFFNDMQTHYATAHVVICRAGASTVTELALSGRPAIFIPYPYAADDHQKKNALAVTHVEGGWIIDQLKDEPKKLAELVEKVYNHPEKLNKKAVNIQKLAKPDAAKEIVNELGKLVR